MSATSAESDSRHPQLPEQLRLAVIAHEDGQLNTAYPLYRSFVADNPEHPTALQLFGLLLSQLGQLEPAISLLRESLRLFPDQAEVANNLGNALSKSGNFDEAMASYKNAIDLMPRYVDAHRNLGLCYTKTGQLNEAYESYEACLAMRPDDVASLFAMANLRRDQGDLHGAIADFEKLLSLDPTHADAHHNLGVCLRLVQQPEKALSHYEKASGLGLDRPELHHNMGNAFVDLQRPDRAIDTYKAALQKNPEDIETHLNLNALLWQQDQLDDYLKSYSDALAEKPGALPLRIAYATALNQKESYGEAEDVIQEGMNISGETSELKSLMAYTLECQDRWDDALGMHASAVIMPDAIPNQLISYGRALLACQRPDEALRQIQAGAALTPFNQRALAYLGLCWRTLGDERDAVLNDYDNLIQIYDVPVPAAYGSTEEFNEHLKAVLEPLHFGKQHPANQTLRGGTQTSGNLFERRDPEILELMTSLSPCITDYLARFPDNDQHPLFSRRSSGCGFSASWSVRLSRCGFHTMHTHPLGWISSAYYVDVPSEIVDSEDYGGGLKFGQPDIDLGADGAASRKIQPATGRLVLFPSYMWHGTVPFESDDPRMTVAFDVMPQ